MSARDMRYVSVTISVGVLTLTHLCLVSVHVPLRAFRDQNIFF